MSIKARKVAFLGLLSAVSVVMIILSGVFETSTVFFLAIASFCVGIAIYEYGIGTGVSVYIACLILGFLLAPNKFYLITYSGFAIYICSIEWTYRFLEKKIANQLKRNRITWVLKYIYFNLIYLPILFLFPKLIMTGTLNRKLVILMVVMGQVVLYLLDRVYNSFMGYYCKELRKRLRING